MRTTPRRAEALQRTTSILHYISWFLSYSIYILIKMLLYFHITKEMTVVEKDETGMAIWESERERMWVYSMKIVCIKNMKQFFFFFFFVCQRTHNFLLPFSFFSEISFLLFFRLLNCMEYHNNIIYFLGCLMIHLFIKYIMKRQIW